MSEDNKNESTQETKESVNDFVSKKAYEEVTADMHKYKTRAKEASAAKAEYEAKLKALEEEKMREGEQWKELAEKYKAENQELQHQTLQVKESFTKNIKRQALKDELGLANDKYLVHADVDAIEINEHGVIDKDSLLHVANSFREEHSVLLQKPSGTNSTSVPAASIKSQPVSLDDLSVKEKMELLRSMKQS